MESTMEAIDDGLPGDDDVAWGGQSFTVATLVLLANGKTARSRR